MSGDVQFFFATITSVVQLVKGGKVTALGVTTRERSLTLPELPTLSEAGLPGFEFNLWVGMFGPARMSRETKEALAKEVDRILALPDVRDRILAQGAKPHTMSPAQFDAFVKSEVERFAKVVAASGAKAD